jgi:DNA-binding NarL/FixJ family response regulator
MTDEENHPMTVSILLVDDHEVFREGLRMLLQSQTDFTIVGEATNSQQAITLTQNLHPDIVILDIAMPGLSGLDAIQPIRAAHEDLRVIILSAHSDEHYAVRALQFGAAGYVLKEQSGAELIHAIREARQGHTYISPSIAARVSQLQGEAETIDTELASKTGKRFLLTRREGQVLDFLIQGLINRDIGLTLGISARTVEVHRTNLMRKLGLNSRAELDRFVKQQKSHEVPPVEDEKTAVDGVTVGSSDPGDGRTDNT